MIIERNYIFRIAILTLVILSVPLVSVCDCSMDDQIMDSYDHCEWDNHFFDLNPHGEKTPDLITILPSEPLFPLLSVSASQVFHPPAAL